jgi:hypothetical protein
VLIVKIDVQFRSFDLESTYKIKYFVEPSDNLQQQISIRIFGVIEGGRQMKKKCKEGQHLISDDGKEYKKEGYAIWCERYDKIQ